MTLDHIAVSQWHNATIDKYVDLYRATSPAAECTINKQAHAGRKLKNVDNYDNKRSSVVCSQQMM